MIDHEYLSFVTLFSQHFKPKFFVKFFRLKKKLGGFIRFYCSNVIDTIKISLLSYQYNLG